MLTAVHLLTTYCNQILGLTWGTETKDARAEAGIDMGEEELWAGIRWILSRMWGAANTVRRV